MMLESSLSLINKKITNKLINGPINKKEFLNKKFLGITEYISSHFKKKNIGKAANMTIKEKKKSFLNNYFI